MKLFAGLSRTDYQDILRAIGAMLDERNLRDVRMWEGPDGLFVQGREPGEPEFETLEFSDDDLQEVLRQSYERRGQPMPVREVTKPVPAPPEPNQDLPEPPLPPPDIDEP